MSQTRVKFSCLSLAAALFVPPVTAQIEYSLGDSGNGAQSPLAIAKLTASDGVAGNALGIAVAASGNTVVVGEDCLRIGNNPNCDTHHQGVVYVYQNQESAGETWSRLRSCALPMALSETSSGQRLQSAARLLS